MKIDTRKNIRYVDQGDERLDLVGAGLKIIPTGDTNTNIETLMKVISGTATTDPASFVYGNEIAEVAVTVAGAANGDGVIAVQVTSGTVPDGVDLVADPVVATNTVNVGFRNSTNIAQDIGSITIKVLVLDIT